MSFQFSPAARNAALDAIEAAVGTSPKLQLRSGALPVNTVATDGGNLLVEIALPSDWLETASVGVKTIKGTWTGTGTAAAGGGTNAGHFRIKTPQAPPRTFKARSPSQAVAATWSSTTPTLPQNQSGDPSPPLP